MVTFSDEIHPKLGLRLRFEYSPRAFQYLDFFKITVSCPSFKFIPLDLTFETNNELIQFLYRKRIVYDEYNLSANYSDITKIVTVVDTKEIYEVEEGIQKYLLKYKYYSINEVAEMLSFSRPTIYKFVDDQKIKAIRINGQLRINHLDLIEFINIENPLDT